MSNLDLIHACNLQIFGQNLVSHSKFMLLSFGSPKCLSASISGKEKYNLWILQKFGKTVFVKSSSSFIIFIIYYFLIPIV
jgi:hypothetical protein